VPIFRRDPRIECAGEIGTDAFETCGLSSSRNWRTAFLIADQRDRASELSFYLRDKRVEGQGHPPVYIVESQDLLNQFSFCRATINLSKHRRSPPTGGRSLLRGKRDHPFEGRSALYIKARDGRSSANIRRCFQSTKKIGTIESAASAPRCANFKIFLCRNYRTLPYERWS